MFYQDFSQNASDWSSLMNQTTSFTPKYQSNTGVGSVGVSGTGGPSTLWRWDRAAGALTGNASQFAPSGYVLQIAMYLDTTLATLANDNRVAYIVGVSNASTPSVHVQDFVFSFGFYDQTNAYGSGRRFISSASNNSPGWPIDAGRSPQVLAGPDGSGWYNFQHRFYPSGAEWYCDMTVWSEDCGTKVANWTLGPVDNPAKRPITLGPPRYAWFSYIQLPSNAIKVAQQVYNVVL